ncbi:hypothetical protein GWK36_11710 [Caldichromatium japonicum]|uniref:Uncharacterized protein n=1 Tax=Caldichromatium japonicum TaxID=2699430 RepID=A0A6G7VFA6_9GAMM|nr:hypothetical protein GWK36_11710 [Caldichromatium japonicum]
MGGEESFAHVAQHDADFTEPKGNVIEKLLPANRPCLILMDEVLNYVSTYRDRGWHNKLYNSSRRCPRRSTGATTRCWWVRSRRRNCPTRTRMRRISSA